MARLTASALVSQTPEVEASKTGSRFKSETFTFNVGFRIVIRPLMNSELNKARNRSVSVGWAAKRQFPAWSKQNPEA